MSFFFHCLFVTLAVIAFKAKQGKVIYIFLSIYKRRTLQKAAAASTKNFYLNERQGRFKKEERKNKEKSKRRELNLKAS